MTAESIRLEFRSVHEQRPDVLQLEDPGTEFPGVKPTVTDEPQLFRAATLLVPIYLPVWDYEFMSEDLQAMASAFRASDPPPVLVNHAWDADKIYGHVRAMRYDSGTQRLRVLLEFLGDHACQRVKDGRWRKLSGGFTVTRGDRSKSRVDEASVTPFPMVGEAQIDKTTEVSMSKTATPPPDGEDKKKEETVAASAQPAAPQTPPPAPKVDPVQAQAPAADVTKDPAFLALQKQFQDLQAERAQEKLEARQAQDKADLIQLVAEGYSLPEEGLQAKEAAFMAKLSIDQKADYLALRRSLPKAWQSGGRQSVPKPAQPGVDPQSAVEAQLLQIGAQRNGKVE